MAEEDSGDLRARDGARARDAVAALVAETLKASFPRDRASADLTSADVLDLIDLGGSSGGREGVHWVLDPIDGTRGFAASRQYAVCLGQIRAGRLALGVLGCPNVPLASSAVDVNVGAPRRDAGQMRPGIGALFSATRGGGAVVRGLHGPGAFRVRAPRSACARAILHAAGCRRQTASWAWRLLTSLT